MGKIVIKGNKYTDCGPDPVKITAEKGVAVEVSGNVIDGTPNDGISVQVLAHEKRRWGGLFGGSRSLK